MKLYTVKLEDEFVVLAADDKEAAKIATRHRLQSNMEVVETTEMDHYPYGWCKDDVPYQEDDSGVESIAELIDMGLAPKVKASQERLAAAVDAFKKLAGAA